MQCEKSHRTASDRSKWSFFGPFFQRFFWLGCSRSGFRWFCRLGCRRFFNRQIGSRFVLFAWHIRGRLRGLHHFYTWDVLRQPVASVRPKGWVLLELFLLFKENLIGSNRGKSGFDWFNVYPGGSKIYPVGDGKSVMRCVRRVAQWVLTIMIGDDILS